MFTSVVWLHKSRSNIPFKTYKLLLLPDYVSYSKRAYQTYYSQPRSRVNSISKSEMNIRISLCNVRRVNGMLDISLEIVPKKTH